MRIFVAITDADWFSHLSSTGPLDEVNFWQPSGNVQFKALKLGEPFLFKLHSPQDFIVGGGFFSHFTILPVSLVWESFGQKNGAPNEQAMRARVEHYRRVTPDLTEDYAIGCILLQSPFFFKRNDWIDAPAWSRSIVRGKGFNSEIEPGKSLWERVRSLLSEHDVLEAQAAEPAAVGEPRFGIPQTILPRLGQGSFRVMVTDAYHRRCAITKSPVLYVLEAAHIKPYQLDGPHSLANGLLLRKDVHTLFDRGYLTVTPQHKIEVSRRIKEEFENGKEYYALHGNSIMLPADECDRPSLEFLSWHNQHQYRG